MKNLLLKEKYRPKNIDDLILLPRIRKSIENGLNQDYILHGLPGCGKTSLCKMISKLYSSITINETSVDILRTKINEFCSYVDLGIDKEPVDVRIEKSGFKIDKLVHNPDNIKVVFLDEFDDISKAFQEGLKTFMENNSNVRFIATSNSVNSILPALKSRFSMLDFNARNTEEENFIKQNFAKRIKTVILPKEDFEMSNEDIVKLVSKNFPDLRQTLVCLQDIVHTGDIDISGTTTIDIRLQEKLFEHVVNKTEPKELYHFIMDNFGADKIEEMIKVLGRPFFNWILLSKPEWVSKTTDISEIVTEYGHMLPTTLDPFVLGMALVGKIQKL